MSLFKKFFGAGNEASDEQQGNDLQAGNFSHLPVDEMFTHHFRKNGGKFLYCDSLTEVREHFIDILEENDWFESEVMCFDPKLFTMLDENKLRYDRPEAPKFLLAGCENLIAD